jgi:hypothetical protein
VPKEESILQYAKSLHQQFHLLKLMTSQLVQLKLLTVPYLVKLALNIQIYVNLVTSTELIHHNVSVLMDSILMLITIVLNVTSDVPHVTLSPMTILHNVLSVPPTESTLQDVTVHMLCTMTCNPLTVNNVTTDVQTVT